MEYALEVTGLSKKYKEFHLKDVNISLPSGCIMGFIGQNGAGNTTTIQLILDIIKGDSGKINIFGMDHHKDGVAIKEEIGVVFDEMGYHESFTPMQINHMMKHVYTHWKEEVFFDYLSRFALPKKQKCGSFSRGMRMKLQIAVALSHEAKLLIMDEPTSGLDPVVRNEILEIFQEFVVDEEHTIMMSSHMIGDLERIADMITFIDRGRILLSGNKDEIIEQHGMVRCKKEDFEKIHSDEFVSSRKSTVGVEALVSNRKQFKREHENLLIEPASLEEILIFYIQRNGKVGD